MKMYVWSKDFLRDWDSGLGVAVAESVDEARMMLIEATKRDGYAGWVEMVARDIVREPDRILELPNAAVCYGGG